MSKMHNLRIVIAGGGTLGHVMPALDVVREIRKQVSTAEFLWIGSYNGMEKEIVSRENIPFVSVQTGKLRRYWSLKNLTDMANIPVGIFQAGRAIAKFKPQVIFGKGGSISVPSVVAGWMQNVPIVIHESDFIPGIANRKMAFYATRIALTFPDVYKFFPPEKTVLTGRPVNAAIFDGDAERGRKFFQLQNDRPVLLITGGSQGAEKINRLVVDALPFVLEKFQVIHQCGQANYAALKETADRFADQGYRLYGILQPQELFDGYALADIIVSRAGSTIVEIAATGKRNLLIPLSSAANNHQKANAEYFAERGVSRVLDEENVHPHLFFDNLMALLYKVDPAAVERNAHQIFMPDAGERIANLVLSLQDAGAF